MMSKHLTDNQLLTLATKPQEAGEEWSQHVAQCAACRDQVNELRATWQLLGRWEVPAQLSHPRSEWQSELLARASRPNYQGFWAKPAQLKIAAMLLIASGIGITLALLSPQAGADTTQNTADVLYFNGLSAQRSIDLESALVTPESEVQP